MKKRLPNKLSYLLLSLALFSGCRQGKADISALGLLSIDGQEFNIARLSDYKASVVFFFAPECPLSQNYTLPIQEIRTQFPSDSLLFLGIFPGDFEADTAYTWFAKKYAVSYPLLRDPENIFTDRLGATITPEVFVLDRKGKILYNGAIDNWAFDLGKKRQVVTEKYLIEALTAVIENREIRIKKTKAIGCIIE